MLINNTTESYIDYMQTCRAGIAQSVHRLSIGWMAGVRFPAGARDISILHSLHTGSGAHPAYPLRTGALSPGIKRPGLKADHSPPSGAQVKNDGAIHPIPVCLHDVMFHYLSTGTLYNLPLHADV
jgi:hypothetical protein